MVVEESCSLVFLAQSIFAEAISEVRGNGLSEIKIDNETDSDLCLYVFGEDAIAFAKEFKKERLKRQAPESHLVDAIDEHGKSVRKVKNHKDTGSEG